MTESKRFSVKGNWIKDNCIGKLLNIDFNTINDVNLCCELLNQIEYEKKENGKIASKFLEENNTLKEENEELKRHIKHSEKRTAIISGWLHDEGNMTLDKYEEILDYCYREYKKENI